MNFEIISKKDLEIFKDQIIQEINSSTQNLVPKKYLRSAEVRKMLGISSGTLQNMRINGTLPYTKLGSTIFYDYDEIIKILNENKYIIIKK